MIDAESNESDNQDNEDDDKFDYLKIPKKTTMQQVAEAQTNKSFEGYWSLGKYIHHVVEFYGVESKEFMDLTKAYTKAFLREVYRKERDRKKIHEGEQG